MPTGNRNGKSVKIWARIPLDLADSLDDLAKDGESRTDFIIQALREEAERRRKEKKPASVSKWV
ncbi:hypothetical protein ZN11_20825 [Salmonella enterica]|uniref:Ribbon-helix-helix protein, CopG family n=2 Tax=Salmonella enterica TaxID=28901 RepID=A0A730AR18_SALON|nr:YlcI/YnfO family protein [Salmonella enterica]ECS7333342.1 hypothetical protein [Salmonella enterica subsp. enterica serovar Berta]EDL3182842.1 hypothetical protein [Salmonella enterica subsp. enterica serovar Give]HAE3616557.1 hypothetical protein [Salmonella enterica subsp. enterica serovar Oranienburg]HBM0000150.1 hypothetical protein [Salmonella enterica subsp. enterica serovar Kodjovi]EAA5748719.1 hypothetical protein [Salmonella enterica]